MTSVHIPGKGVFLDSEVAAFFFRLGSAELGRRNLEGGRAAPELREALDALRAAVIERTQMSAMSADGHVSGQVADMATASKSGSEGVVSTAALADALHVGSRQARRLASQHGVEPAARDAWHTTDVDRLVKLRRTS